MPRVVPDRAEYDDDLWIEWTNVTCEKIAQLEIGEYSIHLIDDEKNIFVQIARPQFGCESSLLAEVSLGEISSPLLSSMLLDMRWEPPGSYMDSDGGSPNYQVIWRPEQESEPLPWADSQEAAQLIASTLRVVLGIVDPFSIPVERGYF